ncbi:MAG TPA: UPF0182 family protein [bacterium]|nr:UPF0182 family protein [bacterium]
MTIRRVLLVVLVGLLVAMPALARWYTEWLWFGEVGYRVVFWTPIVSRVAIALMAGLSVFLILYVNLRLLLRLRPVPRVIELRAAGGRAYRQIVTRLHPGRVTALGAAAVGVVAGVVASQSWLAFQVLIHQVPFGVRDPVLGMDVAFYVFTLPVLQMIYAWLFGWLLVALVVVAIGYYLDLAPLAMRGVWAVPKGVRGHLSVLLGLLALLQAGGFWLQTYGLLLAQRGVVFGAGYTDVHATLPALRLLSVLSAVVGVLLLLSSRMRTFRPAVVALVVLAAAWLVGVQFYPGFVQQFNVAPNELRRETPYIQSSIDATLRAYGLDKAQEKQFPASANLEPAAVIANQSVLDNVRLWDDRPLLRTYSQLQSLRLYYTFTSVGIDRYRVGGREQQVMLAAREMDISRVPSDARTWVNDHLVFTHGYGLVMNPVNRISAEGLPEFYIKDIPPQSVIGQRVTRPELYYGLLATPYVVVHTRTKELDYPQGDRNAYASYAGSGGVPIGGPLSRLGFTYRFGALPLSLSADITPDSRIMFHRAVPERVAHIAPFLTFDHDPYLVLAGGRLFWIVDGYTTSAAYPYSQSAGEINYIRNSVKAVVDAYDGTTRFYVADPTDPIIQTYARVFPGVFVPLSTMPRTLLAHLRYPVDLFTVQAQIFATFHMRDPQVFYNREDLWAVPNELFAGAAQPLTPYYVNLKLDRSSGDEFTLILPFTPSGKDNMVAWMAARSDPPNYGHLLIYRFPKDRTVFGPMQIEARVDQDPTISSQLTLWNQQGSQVIRGNLLVVPIANALLYIEPLYLQASGSALPELKRVIVAYGTRIAMESTLDEALARIFGVPSEESASAAPPSGPLGSGPPVGAAGSNGAASAAPSTAGAAARPAAPSAPGAAAGAAAHPGGTPSQGAASSAATPPATTPSLPAAPSAATPPVATPPQGAVSSAATPSGGASKRGPTGGPSGVGSPRVAAPAAPSGGASQRIFTERVAALVAQANVHYARAQEALRAGDYPTYGREIGALGRVLDELRQVTGAP